MAADIISVLEFFKWTENDDLFCSTGHLISYKHLAGWLLLQLYLTKHFKKQMEIFKSVVKVSFVVWCRFCGLEGATKHISKFKWFRFFFSLPYVTLFN